MGITMLDTTTESPSDKKPSMLEFMRGDVRCVFERDPAARSRFEVLTTYPGVHAMLMHRIAHGLWRRNWQYMARFIAYIVRIGTNIDIHPGATIGERFFIDHGAGVVIGETATIGNDVTIYHGVTLGGTTWNKGKRHPTLGHGVMIGAGAKILGAINLGDDVRVGANSVVVKDVPSGRSVVGIPAKIVQMERVRADNPYGIDLNHHLIPDPVGKAVSCLVERLQALEEELHGMKQGGAETLCEGSACEADDLCNGRDKPSDTPVSDPKCKPLAGG